MIWTCGFSSTEKRFYLGRLHSLDFRIQKCTHTLYVKKNIFKLSVTLEALEVTEQLMDSNEFEVTSNQVMELVSNSSCSAYDCEFVA